MSSDNTQHEKNLRKLLDLSDEQMDSLFQILEDQPHLSKFVAKRKAFVLVYGSLQRAGAWSAGLIGALWLGAEKIGAVWNFILHQIAGLL